MVPVESWTTILFRHFNVPDVTRKDYRAYVFIEYRWGDCPINAQFQPCSHIEASQKAHSMTTPPPPPQNRRPSLTLPGDTVYRSR